jgi:hypothetical protein
MSQTVKFFGVEAEMPKSRVIMVTEGGSALIVEADNSEAFINCTKCSLMEAFASTACMAWRDVMRSKRTGEEYFAAERQYYAWRKIRDIAIRKQKENV